MKRLVLLVVALVPACLFAVDGIVLINDSSVAAVGSLDLSSRTHSHRAVERRDRDSVVGSWAQSNKE